MRMGASLIDETKVKEIMACTLAMNDVVHSVFQGVIFSDHWMYVALGQILLFFTSLSFD